VVETENMLLGSETRTHRRSGGPHGRTMWMQRSGCLLPGRQENSGRTVVSTHMLATHCMTVVRSAERHCAGSHNSQPLQVADHGTPKNPSNW